MNGILDHKRERKEKCSSTCLIERKHDSADCNGCNQFLRQFHFIIFQTAGFLRAKKNKTYL